MSGDVPAAGMPGASGSGASGPGMPGLGEPGPGKPPPEKPIRVAGTAVVLRDGPAGPEVLLMRRPRAGSFPDAWVFPGGSLEPADRAGAATEADAARNAAVRETFEEAGIRIRDLVALSRWTPPAETPVRFRTWFFLAREFGDEVVPNAGEVEEVAWLTAGQVFDGHAAGSMILLPPTWVTLHALLAHRTVDDAYAAVGEPEHFATHMQASAEGTFAVWHGDEAHPEAPGAAGARHRLLMGALPWTYQRG